MDPLFASLLDLFRELDTRGVPLTVGGGFGLYLKRMHLEGSGERTLFAELPSVRSELTEELHGLEFVHACELDREVREGSYHTGIASVVQVVGVRAGQPAVTPSREPG